MLTGLPLSSARSLVSVRINWLAMGVGKQNGHDDTLQRWPVSKRVNSSRAADDDPTLIEMEAGIATLDEISAAANYFARNNSNCL